MISERKAYLIGEIGQNHNGSVDIAKLIIEGLDWKVKDELFNNDFRKFDAVKLTKRDLKYELSNSQMEKPYTGPNSFGSTYGLHREYLELSDEEHFEVYKYAKEKGFDFVETLCAPSCISILKYFTPDYLKVASRDLTNIPLLEVLSETDIPIIISTGMAGEKELDEALKTITKYHEKISILHCVSEYPTKPQNVNLNTILWLKEKYPQYQIGYSDHSIGISVPVAAYAMGADIIEKHVTIDRRMKGTDQKGSLAIDGCRRLIRDLRQMELSMGRKGIFIEGDVQQAKIKLERSIAASRDLLKGEILDESDLELRSPGDGVQWTDRQSIIGRELKRDVKSTEIIYPHYLV